MEYVKRRRKVATKSIKFGKKGQYIFKNEHAALLKKHKIKEVRVSLIRCDEDERLDQNESCGESDDFPGLTNTKSIFNRFNYYQFFGINESHLEVFKDSACTMYRNASLEKTMYVMWALTFASSEFENHLFNGNISSRIDHARERTATLHYIIRMAAVHSNRSCVFGCCKVVQRLLRKGVPLSLSRTEVFQLLFNYGVDTELVPIFSLLPEEQSFEHMTQFHRNKMPDDWGLNFDAVLMIIRAVMENSLLKDPDDSYILLYIFIIYTDDAQRKSITFDNFVRTAFETFSRESWVSAVKSFASSYEDTAIILDIVQHLPYTHTGIEVKAVLAFETLSKICKKYKEKDADFSIHNFLGIISAAFHVKKDLLPIVVKFLDVIIRYYLETAEKDEVKVIEFAMQSFEKYVKMKCKDASINVYFMTLAYAFNSALNYKAKPFQPTHY